MNTDVCAALRQHGLEQITLADAIGILLNHAKSSAGLDEKFAAQSEPMKDTRPAIERSMELLRIQVSHYEMTVCRLHERLVTVLRPVAAQCENDAVGAERPLTTSDHNFQIESVTKYLTWANARLDDLIDRLEVPLPQVPLPPGAGPAPTHAQSGYPS